MVKSVYILEKAWEANWSASQLIKSAKSPFLGYLFYTRSSLGQFYKDLAEIVIVKERFGKSLQLNKYLPCKETGIGTLIASYSNSKTLFASMIFGHDQLMLK